MLNKIRTQQFILILAMVLLVGFLFSRDVKGLVAPKNDGRQMPSPSEGPMAPTAKLNIEEVSTTAKNLVSNAMSKEISLLETNFKRASGNDKITQAKELAQKWDDVEQSTPSALYLEVVANGEPTAPNWLLAGNRFLKAFDTSTPEDSLATPILLAKANEAFKNALKIDTSSIDAKTGMGITIVNGMGAPMEGIAMLRSVVAKDPKNLKANMKLGEFAIKSGQYDKAIIRFNDIIKNIKATPDAYLYLATAHEFLGHNEEAIDAYLNSKKLAANPTLSSFIDKRVNELRKKR